MRNEVETLRKPSTGLKRPVGARVRRGSHVETLRKPSTGLKLRLLLKSLLLVAGRDTQKTQHGIETNSWYRLPISMMLSRHSENPARD